jgi:hypothetical protein
VFEQLRQSLEDLLNRATKPEDRRTVLARMKTTLVQARLGVDDLREALEKSRRQLEAERKEVATLQRRKQLATDINDTETVAVAERFEKQHEERARLLEEKVAVQTREVEIGDRELEEMKVEFRRAMAGIPGMATTTRSIDEELDDMLGGTTAAGGTGQPGEAARQEIDSLARERARAERDAEAARRLEELKRKMGR